MPLVVKIADTQKDKDIKRFYQTQQQHQQQLPHQPHHSGAGSLPGQAAQQTSQYLSVSSLVRGCLSLFGAQVALYTFLNETRVVFVNKNEKGN